MSGFKPSHQRIRHFVAGEDTTVEKLLAKHFKLAPDRITDLLQMGAIYQNKKRVFSDGKVAKGEYLRLHLQPKRFSLEGIDWAKVIVDEKPEFLVCHKPAGIPAHPTLDNQVENLLHQMRRETGKELFITQRIDVPVEGLIVLAKTPAFQKRFNQMLSDRKVGKKYTARVAGMAAPSVGRKVHYMKPSEAAPRIVSADPAEGWQICELSILTAEPRDEGQFEVTVDLHTGRTHQIRAQLSALGHPIVGDRMYGSRVKYPRFFGREAIALAATEIEWKGAGPYRISVDFEQKKGEGFEPPPLAPNLN